MPNVDDKVMAAVESALKKNPDASVDELFTMAKGMSPSVGKLSKRQFHARYPLQVKRKMKPAKRRKAAPGKKASRGGRKPAGRKAAAAPAHESVRGVLLRFAADLAGAEERKDVVRVVAGVDRYVEDVLKAAGRS